jgi:hypothetical protein
MLRSSAGVQRRKEALLEDITPCLKTLGDLKYFGLKIYYLNAV